MWSQILVIVCTIISILYLTFKVDKSGVTYSLALLSLSGLLFLYLDFDATTNIVSAYGSHARIISFCGLLSIEMILLRNSIQGQNGFPYFFVFFPFFAYILFPLGVTSESVSFLISMLLGTAAAIVSFLILILLNKNKRYVFAFLSGLVLLAVSFIYKILSVYYITEIGWVIDVPLSLGMIPVVIGFTELYNDLTIKTN